MTVFHTIDLEGVRFFLIRRRLFTRRGPSGVSMVTISQVESSSSVGEAVLSSTAATVSPSCLSNLNSSGLFERISTPKTYVIQRNVKFVRIAQEIRCRQLLLLLALRK